MDKKELLRQIPKIDQVLKDRRLFDFFDNTARDVIVESAREVIISLRERILNCEEGEQPKVDSSSIIDEIIELIESKSINSLRPLINATGTILHTNLGRSRLSEEVSNNISLAATNYSTLEYDLEKGKRGSRHDHIEKLIAKITGAESAMVVNNNAAAVLLCLSALAKGKEAIVSRGELVEIGGSFRIPEIMELGGAILKEVGTTNKTKHEDYENAVDIEKTGVILKVHTSNYKIMGFTAEVALTDLAVMGKSMEIPVVYDLGSGLMVNLRGYGIDEPTVQESVKCGADVITFSGDKLLGGPQAGIIIGKKAYIDRMKKHQLARVVRVDKMTLAGLEATFREYLNLENALNSIPALSMITADLDEIRHKAIRLAERIRKETHAFDIDAIKLDGEIGGGSTPNQFIKSYGIAVKGRSITADAIERYLRFAENPVISRINRDRVIVDVRTLTDEEINIVAKNLIECGKNTTRGESLNE